MKFLVDECLHRSLVPLAVERGHEAWHVNWLGLSGTADWDLMPRILSEDFTFLTNNAQDFRRLYARTPLHAGLVIFVSQVSPAVQRRLFMFLLDGPEIERQLVNEAVDLYLEDNVPRLTRYELFMPERR